jgi:hypothetical protein
MSMKYLLLAASCASFVSNAACAMADRPNPASSAAIEQAQQDLQMQQMLRNQPVPSFNFSLERHMLIEIYKARQKATNTFTVVQSELTGKVLWSCPSMGFPLPYSAQLTNPLQAWWKSGAHEYASAVVAQQEPNGLFTPPQAEGTWVPCLDAQGRITPVYEERKVTVFPQPMEERDGRLQPVAGSTPSLAIGAPR